jgi:tetratricopeptide (TPR) repeat protein
MTEQLKEDLPAVIAEFEKTVAEFPENVMAQHHLGLVYMKAGRIEEAIACLEKGDRPRSRSRPSP